MPPLPALAESNVGGPGAVGLPTVVVVVVPAVVAAAVRVPDATPAPAAANTSSATPSVARLINLQLRAWQSGVNAPAGDVHCRARACRAPRGVLDNLLARGEGACGGVKRQRSVRQWLSRRSSPPGLRLLSPRRRVRSRLLQERQR